jgi:O-antigen/teichoic acid export membrane protein
MRSSGARRSVLLAACALASRLSVFGVLAAARTLSRAEFDFVAYLIGATTAAQLLLDPGTANLVVRSARDGARWRGMWRAGLRLQGAVAVAVTAGAVAVALAVHASRKEVVVAAALGLLAGGEGVARFARVTWQIAGAFRRYAGVDLLIAGGRIVTAVALAVSGSTRGLLVACMIVALPLATLVPALARPDSPGERVRLRTLLAEVWPYGASTSFSATYAQLPALLLGILGSVPAAALFSVMVRIVQATELVPASIAAVHLPQLVESNSAERAGVFRSQAGLAVGSGVTMALVSGLSGVAAGVLFGFGAGRAAAVVWILAAALPVKFLNYQLVALAIANGRIRARLVASGCVALVALVGLILLARYGAPAVAALSLGTECLLLMLLVVAARLQPLEHSAVAA